jgi:hypothetical protein
MQCDPGNDVLDYVDYVDYEMGFVTLKGVRRTESRSSKNERNGCEDRCFAASILWIYISFGGGAAVDGPCGLRQPPMGASPSHTA